MFKNLIGPSQKEIFAELAHDLGARLSLVPSRSGRERSRIDYTFKRWNIVLDLEESDNIDGMTYYTRARALFNTNSTFRFEIYRDDLIATIGKLFGLQDIVIGDRPFDKEFIIQGNDEDLVCELLHNERIKNIISSLQHVQLSVHNAKSYSELKLDDQTGMVMLKTGGIISDKRTLRNILELFTLMLTQLALIGVADDRPPLQKI
jgi:hypothetical protein